MQLWTPKVLLNVDRQTYFQRRTKDLVSGRFSSDMQIASSFSETFNRLAQFILYHVLFKPVNPVHFVFDLQSFKINPTSWDTLQKGKASALVVVSSKTPEGIEDGERFFKIEVQSNFDSKPHLLDLYFDSPNAKQRQRLEIIRDNHVLDVLGSFLHRLYLTRYQSETP